MSAGKIAPTVSFTGAPASAVYQTIFTVVTTSNSGVTPTITAIGSCSISGSTVTMTSGTGKCTMKAQWAATTYYLAASATQSTTAAKVAPAVIFTGAPPTAQYQSTFTVSAASNTSVIPTITVTGSCSIRGTTVSITSGTGTCTMTAKWAANSDYLAASATQATTDEKQSSIITWPAPAAITYPAKLGATQLNATANVPGKFVYSPAAGSVLNAGLDTLTVTFTPTSSKYTTATASVALQVNQAATTITWSTPAAITYGTPLSAAQLNAVATPVSAGTYLYSPPAGTVVNVGSQTLSVQFTPFNTNTTPSSGMVTLQVNQSGPNQLFDHVVFVVQENRSLDNLFGSNPTFEPGELQRPDRGPSSRRLGQLL